MRLRQKRNARLRDLALLCLMMWIAALFIGLSPVNAHANLVRSEPEANAVLDIPPLQARLWFSETPEPGFSQIQVLDQNGTVLQGVSPIRIDSSDPKLMYVSLPNLAFGVYTVTWQVLSSADGHTTLGAFAFAVGKDQRPISQNLTGQVAGTSSTPTLLGVSIRWLSYLTMALLTGGFAFVPLVFQPVLLSTSSDNHPKISSAGGPPPASFSHASGLFLALVIAYMLLLAATLVGAVVQANSVGGNLIQLLTSTRYGIVFWGRLALIITLGGLLVFRQSHWWHRGMATLWWNAGLVINGLILLTTSLGSHAAAEGSILPVASDWIHLVSMGVWIGGLVSLLLTLLWLWRTEGSGSARLLANLVTRFSKIATICVVVITISGVFRAGVEIADLANLIDTPYGTTLLAKLGLIVPLIGIAALNLLLIQRRMTEAAKVDDNGAKIQPWYRMIRRTVSAEIVFLISILLVTGFLTSLPPARVNFGAGVVTRAQAEDLRVLVAANPGTAGMNTFDIYVKDTLNRPISNVQKVALVFSMAGHTEMGETEALADRVSDGHFTVQGGYTPMYGTWQVNVSVRRSGRDDVRLQLTLPLTVTGQFSVGPILVSPIRLVLGIEIVVGGIILIAGARRLGRTRPKADIVGHMIAGAALGLGAVIAIGAFATGADAIVAIQNPIPADSTSLARGQQVYQTNCLTCHGSSGIGDGPLAASLKPPPANLRVHMTTGHPDGQLFEWISNGIAGTAMPAFGMRLNEKERWDVINYVRTFGSSR